MGCVANSGLIRVWVGSGEKDGPWFREGSYSACVLVVGYMVF